MAKPEWGVKRTCVSCGVRFYDFRRAPIVCPGCSAEFLPEAALRPRRSRAVPEPEKAPVAVAVAVPADDDNESLAEDDLDKELAGIEGDDVEADDDAVIEDTSDLGSDDDELSEVAENIDKGSDD